MAGITLDGKFGAPPVDENERTTFKQEWANFFTKLKQDPDMQTALLSFAANVTNPEFGDNQTQAISSSLLNAVSGYRGTKEARAAAGVKAKQTQEKHDADLEKTKSEIVQAAVENALKTTQIGKTQAETSRISETGVELDQSQIELNRARAAAAAAEAAAGGKGAKAPTHIDKLAQALLAQGLATDESDAYLQATELNKTPAGAKMAADFIAAQGFLYGDDLPAAVEQAVSLAQGASGLNRGASNLQPTAPAPQIDMNQLRKLSDAYTSSKGMAPVSEAKLLELSQNPQAVQSLLRAVQPPTE